MKKNITVDTKKAHVTPYDRTAFNSIGSGHAYLALREDFREHLRLVQKEIGFEYIRFHGILMDWVGIYNEDENGKSYYNFQNYDKIMDFLLEIGIRPIVEFSFMPEALASGEETVQKYRGNISPPKDFGKWRRLVKALVEHSIERYGLEEVLNWKFEVWNEPDLDVFWSGTQKEYFRLYSTSVKVIKKIDKRLKVGGPSTSRNRWIDDFLDFCKKSKLPLDFISTHIYCADIDEIDGVETEDVVYRGYDCMKRDALITSDKIAASAFPDAEFIYTEWNVSPIHYDIFGKDSEFTAAFILSTVKDVSPIVDGLAYWTFSDIFEEAGPGKGPFSGKYGLLNQHGIKKAPYYSYYFLSRLFAEEIVTSEDTLIVTKSEAGDYRMLAWQLCEPYPEKVDFYGGEWKIRNRKSVVKLELAGVSGSFEIKGYEVSKDAGNSLRAWQEMGSPEYLSVDEVQQLKQKSEPALVIDDRVECDNTLLLEYSLNGNAMVFLDIKKL